MPAEALTAANRFAVRLAARQYSTARLFLARRGAFAFPYRRCGGAFLSAGAGDADDIEEIAHHAKIVSLAARGAASTRLGRARCCRRDDLIGLARLCDRCAWRACE